MQNNMEEPGTGISTYKMGEINMSASRNRHALEGRCLTSIE